MMRSTQQSAAPSELAPCVSRGDGQSVMLTEEDGVKTVLQDAEMELRWRYGWTIPVSSLRYWALGIPDPGSGRRD